MILRDVSISDPKFETENLRYLTVQSSYLKGRGDITAFVPQVYETHVNLPIVILLHGVYASHWAWTRQMNVHNTALEMMRSGEVGPSILLMPSDGLNGGGTGYVKYEGYDYEKWIVEDVLEAAYASIPQVSSKSNVFISGLSMGGYGALRIACKYGNIFKATSGHSSITDMDDLKQFIDDGPVLIPKNEAKKTSVIQTIIDHKNTLPHIRFDCGTEDELFVSNKKLHNELTKIGIKHMYEEFSGGHTGEYWGLHIRESLRFFNQFY